MKKSEESTKVIVDLEKNRLYIHLNGAVCKKDIERIYADIKFGVEDLQAGFDVITDLRHCKIGHLAGIPTFKKIMGFLAANGVNKVVRVVGKSKVILKQMSRITSSVRAYSPLYVSSFEEAEDVLSSPTSQSAQS